MVKNRSKVYLKSVIAITGNVWGWNHEQRCQKYNDCQLLFYEELHSQEKNQGEIHFELMQCDHHLSEDNGKPLNTLPSKVSQVGYSVKL